MTREEAAAKFRELAERAGDVPPCPHCGRCVLAGVCCAAAVAPPEPRPFAAYEQISKRFADATKDGEVFVDDELLALIRAAESAHYSFHVGDDAGVAEGVEAIGDALTMLGKVL